jgi:hypothetical protein
MADIVKSIDGNTTVFAAESTKAMGWMNTNYGSTTVRFDAKQMPDSVAFTEKAEQAGLSVGPVATSKTAHARTGS